MSSTTTQTAQEQYDHIDYPYSIYESVHAPQFGAHVTHRASQSMVAESRMSIESFDLATPATGAQTPDPLFRGGHGYQLEDVERQHELGIELDRIATNKSIPHMGTPMENLARSSTSEF